MTFERTSGWLVSALVVGLCTACSPNKDVSQRVAEGRAAFDRGAYQEAFVAHQAAVETLGEDASQDLLFDTALTALLANSPRDAEIAAARAAAQDFRDTAIDARDAQARSAFLHGHAAWQRCIVLAAQASGPEAGPADLTLAIRAADSARLAWIEAACSAEDWPEATRNAERAGRKLAELEALADAAARGKTRKESAGQNPGTPDAPPKQAPKLVQRMLEQLAARERAKQELRRRARNENGAPVEKDW